MHCHIHVMILKWVRCIILILTGCAFTMRRISVSANTAPRCTTCIHAVYMLYSKWTLFLAIQRPFTAKNEFRFWSLAKMIIYWLSVGDSSPYGRLSCRPCEKIQKYSTCPRNKVWAFRRTPYSLDECCIFQYYPAWPGSLTHFATGSATVTAILFTQQAV